MKMVSVARKPSTIEERCQDQSCLFRRGDYKNKGRSTETLSWVRVLTRRIISVTRKLSTKKKSGAKAKFVLFGEITGTNVTNPKTAPGSSLCEDVGSRMMMMMIIIIIFL
jgi:hypothetical protein